MSWATRGAIFGYFFVDYYREMKPAATGMTLSNVPKSFARTERYRANGSKTSVLLISRFWEHLLRPHRGGVLKVTCGMHYRYLLSTIARLVQTR
jgi:hypothetical protein